MRSRSPLYVRFLQLVYDLVYFGILTLASPYLLYCLATSAKHRAGLAERLGFLPVLPDHGPRIWIHGVSVGEVLAAKSLVEVIERDLPGYEVVISTTTKTGQEVARQHYPGRRVFYYPLDFSWSTRRVLRRVRPRAVILMELEIWPNFLLATSLTDVPVLLVNGRISTRSFRHYGILQRVIPEPMGRILLYCVQTKTYADRFRALGVGEDRVHVTGTMKYDNIRTEGAEDLSPQVRRELLISPEAFVLLGGSTHPTEEETLLGIYRKLVAKRPHARLILAPRHPERLLEVEGMLRRCGVPVVRKTRLGKDPSASGAVILLDTMGELARIYAAADVVFVGGSLIPHGGQNMMEPAGLGRAVLFGPHIRNFQESVDILLDAKGAVMVRDPEHLAQAILEFAGDPSRGERMGERARRVVSDQKGASERILARIRPFLAGGPALEPAAPAARGPAPERPDPLRPR